MAEGHPHIPVSENLRIEVAADILHHGAPAVPELVVAVEGGRSGRRGIVVDKVDVVDLKVVPGVLGRAAGIEGHALEVQVFRPLPPLGVDGEHIVRPYKGPCSHRGIGSSGRRDNGEIQQTGQPVIGLIHLHRDGFRVRGVIGSDVGEPSHVEVRLGGLLHGVDHVGGGEVLAAGEFGVSQRQRIGQAVVGHGILLTKQRLRLKLVVHHKQALIDELHHCPVLHSPAVVDLPAVGLVIGHGKGPGGGTLRSRGHLLDRRGRRNGLRTKAHGTVISALRRIPATGEQSRRQAQRQQQAHGSAAHLTPPATITAPRDPRFSP